MDVNLEFVDGDIRIHEEELVYPGMIPIPEVGEAVVLLESGGWKVESREFYYWTAGVKRESVAQR